MKEDTKFRFNSRGVYEYIPNFLNSMGGVLPAGTKLKISTYNNLYSIRCRLIYGTEIYDKVRDFFVGKKIYNNKEFTTKKIRYCRIILNDIENVELDIERGEIKPKKLYFLNIILPCNNS